MRFLHRNCSLGKTGIFRFAGSHAMPPDNCCTNINLNRLDFKKLRTETFKKPISRSCRPYFHSYLMHTFRAVPYICISLFGFIYSAVNSTVRVVNAKKSTLCRITPITLRRLITFHYASILAPSIKPSTLLLRRLA